MVMDKPDEPLGYEDWKILFPRSAKRVVRIDVPFPTTREGLYALAHHFAGLSQELHMAAKGTTRTFHAIADARRAVIASKAYLAQRNREWEDDYREMYCREIEREESREQGGSITATPSQGDTVTILPVGGKRA